MQITTTPSVFSIDDIKYGDKTAEVNIVAKFLWGQETVETITVASEQNVGNIKKPTELQLDEGVFQTVKILYKVEYYLHS